MKLWPCVLSGILVAGCGDSEDPGSDRSFAIELDPTQDTTPTIVLAGSHLIDPFCEDNPGAWLYIKYYPLMRSGGYSKAFVPCESVPTLATSDAPTEIPELPPDAADELAPFDLACAFTVSDTAPAALVKIQEGVGNCGEPLLAIPFTRLRPAATISCSPPVVSGIAPDMEKSPDEGSVFEVCFQDRL